MPSIKREIFGQIESKDVFLYTLSNKDTQVKITNYGGIITSIIVPDMNDNNLDVVLGFDNLDQYLGGHPHFGGIIGRYANRIGGASFVIDGEEYELEQNIGNHNLHSGPSCFDSMIHDVETFETDDTVGIILSRISPHLESGFPGNLYYKIYYTLNDENELLITYEATCDQSTHVNLTNHSYFNLAGEGQKDAMVTELIINSTQITEVDEDSIPTGEYYKVEDTALDFTKSKPLSNDITADNMQLRFGAGYDHNFVLDTLPNSLELAAIAYDPRSGIEMEVYTTEPGVQLYSANWLDGTLQGKSGLPYQKRSAFCLETQHFPDSPNKSNFPSTLLKKGQQYQSQTAYKFGLK